MPSVDVTIGKRNYSLVCGAGQEGHLRQLAAKLSARIDTLSKQMGASSTEAMLLVFAALMVQDELNETQTELKTMRKALVSAGVSAGSITNLVPEPQAEEVIIEALNAVSDYVGKIADRIENMEKRSA